MHSSAAAPGAYLAVGLVLLLYSVGYAAMSHRVSNTGAFFAFVGLCAVITQGALIGRLQPIFGEARLVVGGLALMAAGLPLVLKGCL